MEPSPRVVALVAVVLLSSGLLAGQALSDPGDPAVGNETDAYPGHTLVTFQAEGWFGNNNGYALVVGPDGESVWKWQVPNSRVFDAEHLENGNILASVAVVVPGPECPDEHDGRDVCVHNRVVEIDWESKDVVWEYDWYDAFPTHHEVHDADRLPSGETAIADMGNHRAFTVNQQGEVTWEWKAENHISEGTEFWNEYVPDDQQEEFRRKGPESDWTHLNDIDRLENGNFLLSVRNFDVVLEVNRAKEIVEVYGSPGDHSVMNEQHNPNLLERRGTMLIADSENNRIVEIDAETDEIVWRYATLPADSPHSPKSLQWPRDADRLPNGNTLITDSRRFRVVEVNPNGSVVWSFDTQEQLGAKGIVYEADRIHLDGEYLPEEPENVPSGRNLEGQAGGPLGETLGTLDSWLGFVLPPWMGLTGVALALVDLGALVALGVELRRART
ncbi:aryl-sulfate sulfotransferase [Halorarius halobius]|uniref:aryl-sulfate sulfotransferase n=1 Tax=Halorarius halobius TaxID=2962671 RepID=UPI0020CC069C|nr:aryl-sulfate sulfotransferase [Halorarius halobius]